MSKATIIDNDLLKSEVEALYNYVNRDSCNIAVVEKMLDELHYIIMGLQPLDEIAESVIDPIVTCPYCGSNNVQYMYGTALLTTNKNQFSCHYLCKDCHKEFDVQK